MEYPINPVDQAATNCLVRVRERLVNLIDREGLKVHERARAGEVLGWLGDSRPGVGLRPDGLPDISWIPIPSGAFLMGDDLHEARIQSDYQIARYPITVTQYEAFVNAGGYADPGRRYWTETGWEWKNRFQIERPFNAIYFLSSEEYYDFASEGAYDFARIRLTPNHPRVEVSWHESLAFCRWLGEKLGLNVQLPSEAEWERAARHIDGRQYPWGSQEEGVVWRCNSKLGNTTAVGLFPSGKAECGALDLAGNSWEWCRSKYDNPDDEHPEGNDRRVLRGGSCGGSFGNHQNDARCTQRIGYEPFFQGTPRFGFFGFRVVASPF